ncbi:MAG: hypothetical protein WBW48_01635 [Anaerolineae bacterium]
MGKFVKGDIVVAPFPFSEEAFQFLLATAMHEAGKQARCSAWCGQR